MRNVVIIELNEHDASRLLTFTRQQIPSGDIWGVYWARIARQIEQGIENLSLARREQRYQESCHEQR